METEDKVRENRLRRMAGRYGYKLVKSRIRDPRALGFGGYNLVDVSTNGAVYPSNPVNIYSADLDDIEHFLTSDSE